MTLPFFSSSPDHQRLHCLRRVSWAILLLAAGWAGAQENVPTRIVTDGTLPGQPITTVGGTPNSSGNGRIHEIHEELGARSGANLFHSFEYFDVGAGDQAHFTANTPVENLVSRITGSDPSRINGSITVGEMAATADFIFVNPNGIVFGEGAAITAPGSVHFSTADEVRFANPSETFSARAPSAGELAIARPEAFGFLSGDVAGIEVAGQSSIGRLRVLRGRNLSFVGGDLTIEGAALEAQDGDVRLISVDSAGQVHGIFDETDAIRLEGFRAFGDIQLLDGAQVSSSAIAPRFFPFFNIMGEPSLTPPTQLAGLFLGPDGTPITLASVRALAGGQALQPGDVLLEDGLTFDLVLRPNVLPNDGAGTVMIRANDLLIRDSSVQALNPGDQSGGRIDVALEGDLSIERIDSNTNVGLLAEAGYQLSGTQTFVDFLTGVETTLPVTLTVAGEGDSGSISISSRNLTIEGGGEISTTSFSGGRTGDITLDIEERVSIRGSSTTGSATSALFSSTQGGGDGGNIVLRAAELELFDEGSIISQSTTDANAGNVEVEVDRLTITGRSQIDSSTSAKSIDSPIFFQGNAGDAGDVLVRAHESIRIEGDGTTLSGEFANIRSSSQAQSVGDAGRLRVETPELTITNAGGIEVVTQGAGNGGEIEIDAERIRLDGQSFISARSFATQGDPVLAGLSPGDAGNIRIGPDDGTFSARDLVLDGASEIATSAVSAEGGNITIEVGGLVRLDNGSGIDASDTGGEGGNVLIPALDALIQPETVVVDGNSRILARAAIAGGEGGVIRIAADNVFVSPDSLIDAENEVVIDAPDTNLNSGLARPASAFLDAGSLVRPPCAARLDGNAAGSFSVARTPSVPPAPGDLLVAFEGLSTPSAAASAAAALGSRGGDSASQTSNPDDAAENTGKNAASDIAPGAADLGALLQLGRSLQERGQFRDAYHTLQRALDEATRSGGRSGMSAALGQLANTTLALGDLETSRRLIADAIDQAEALNDPDLRASLIHARGNLALRSADPVGALKDFDSTHKLAASFGNRNLEAKALSNAARAAVTADQPKRGRERLVQGANLADHLPPGLERIRLRIHLARSFELLLDVGDAAERREALLAGHGQLVRAAEEAKASEDAFLESYALGHLGGLYLREGRTEEALHLTQTASRLAESTGAVAGLARWSWQEGRLLWAKGQVAPALDALERAVGLLEEARQAIILQRGDANALDFRYAVAPIYRDLTERLLEASDLAGNAHDRKALLVRARSVTEVYKAAELRDYFRDQCVADLEMRTVSAEQVADGAAVVYPIALDDRLELLVTLPGGIERYTVAESAQSLEKDAREFRDLVMGLTNRYRRPAKRLYDALVAPYEAELEKQGIETIVWVPDGALLTVPFAALWDGEAFLIERYAVSTTPTLDLVDPRPLDRSALNPLLVGVSEGISDFAPLPAVEAELASVKERIGGRVLLNAAFSAKDFAETIANNRPGVIHIASHAVFGGDPSASFLLAHDGPLEFERFGSIIRSTRFRDEPVELLVLSACQTAAGNDRAALGLAGLAIRSGARSAIGSLWRVDDWRTTGLFEAFYDALEEPGMSRAGALRAAQLTMIRSSALTRHPRDWAAFQLISNWL